MRSAADATAAVISTIIVRALTEVSARGYPIDAIAEMVAGVGPEGERACLAARTVFVAVAGREILGTAGWRKPQKARSCAASTSALTLMASAGSRLFATVEAFVYAILNVPASLTPESFYRIRTGMH